MDRKVGREKLLECPGRGEACKTDKQKQQNKTNKQNGFKPLGSLTFFALMLKTQLLIKLLP